MYDWLIWFLHDQVAYGLCLYGIGLLTGILIGRVAHQVHGVRLTTKTE